MVAQRSIARKEREAERRQQLAQELSDLAVLDGDQDGLFIAVPSVSVPDGAPHRVSVHQDAMRWIIDECDCTGYRRYRHCIHTSAASLLVARISRMSERVSTTSQEYAHAEREERQARYERWVAYEMQIGAR